MFPKSGELAMRDPALAALMGALPGGDFGSDPLENSQADFGAQFGISPYDVHANMGADFGLAPGVAAWNPGSSPTPAAVALMAPGVNPSVLANSHPALVQAWAQQQAQTQQTDGRSRLLDPNRGSHVKVERYSFSMSTVLALNTPSAFSITLQPNVTIRPQRLIANAPTPNFVLLSSLQIANVNVFVGTQEDAFTYSAGAMGVMLDLPTLDPAYRATAAGNYTGIVPPGFSVPFSYTFVMTLQGPAAMAGASGL
jgi:hypothetical protein